MCSSKTKEWKGTEEDSGDAQGDAERMGKMMKEDLGVRTKR